MILDHFPLSRGWDVLGISPGYPRFSGKSCQPQIPFPIAGKFPRDNFSSDWMFSGSRDITGISNLFHSFPRCNCLILFKNSYYRCPFSFGTPEATIYVSPVVSTLYASYFRIMLSKCEKTSNKRSRCQNV